MTQLNTIAPVTETTDRVSLLLVGEIPNGVSEEIEVNILEVLIAELDKDVDAVKEEQLRKCNNEQMHCEVPDKGQDKLSTRWLITTKLNEGKFFTKARLVFRGHKEKWNVI